MKPWQDWGSHPVVVGVFIFFGLAGLLIGLGQLHFAAFPRDAPSHHVIAPPRPPLSDLGRKLVGVWYAKEAKQSNLVIGGEKVRHTFAHIDRYGLLADGSLSLTSELTITDVGEFGVVIEQTCSGFGSGTWELEGQLLRVKYENLQLAVKSITRNGQVLDPRTVPDSEKCSGSAMPKAYVDESNITKVQNESIELSARDTSETETWSRKRPR